MSDNKKDISNRKINKQIDNLNTSVDNLYSSIYSTRVDNNRDMERITDGINDNLNDLLSSVNGQNVSNISNLIIRLQKKSGSNVSDMNKELQSMLAGRSSLDNINMENISKYIQAENYQYDLILKYVPKLKEALEIMKDNVLSSDNFTKDFLNIVGYQSGNKQQKMFNSRVSKLVDKYNFQELFEEMYIKTAKYGEYFLYHVPYKQAFQRLLKRRDAPTVMEGAKTSDDVPSQKVIFEAAKFKSDLLNEDGKDFYSKDFLKDINESNGKVILKMDPYGIIPEAVEMVTATNKNLHRYTSLSETFTESVMKVSAVKEDDNGEIYTNQFHRGTGALKYDNTLAMSHDGMISSMKDDATGDPDKIKDMVGCVMYEIPRENIVPLYIGDFCLGYYYISIVNDYISKQVLTGNQYNSLTATSEIKDTEVDRQMDKLVSDIASSLSTAIDTKFINANIDLREEIYAILRYNDNFNASKGVNTINVSFIPAEDIHHFYFQLDKKTHRGISDLQDSIVPAMMYSVLYLTDIINKISRSQDHRIYYVKQNIETNVARTMLNVVSQIKKGNMGMRQLENMNTIFNVIGKFNDFIVPKSPSGDTPIEFEVLPGQQTDTPTELMERMEEDAVNRTDTPYEFVNSVNQVDFATRFTMSNSKFLRKVFKRQMKCQRHFTQIFRKSYNFEYNENDSTLEVHLPAPAFLSMTNSQQLLDNTKNYATLLADIEIPDQDDEVKKEFIKLLMHNYLGGNYVDFDAIDRYIEQARQNVNIQA